MSRPSPPGSVSCSTTGSVLRRRHTRTRARARLRDTPRSPPGSILHATARSPVPDTGRSVSIGSHHTRSVTLPPRSWASRPSRPCRGALRRRSCATVSPTGYVTRTTGRAGYRSRRRTVPRSPRVGRRANTCIGCCPSAVASSPPRITGTAIHGGSNASTSASCRPSRKSRCGTRGYRSGSGVSRARTCRGIRIRRHLLDIPTRELGRGSGGQRAGPQRLGLRPVACRCRGHGAGVRGHRRIRSRSAP